MQLKIGNINITDIQFGKETKVEKGVLYVNKEQVMAAVADERLTNITLELARPGESVRIMPVKDVIEPRLKIEGNGGVFPGFVNKVDMVGSGTTLVLRGSSCHRRQHSWLPGRHHRHVRTGGRLYSLLQAQQPCRCL